MNPVTTDIIAAQVLQLEKAEDISLQNNLTEKLVVYNSQEFMDMNIPEREPLLYPWLLNQGISMIYSKRGVGKTYLAIAIAYAVATGTPLLQWNAPSPHRVLYIDGELPSRDLQDRVRKIGKGTGKFPENLYLLTPDFQEYGIPDLGSRKGQNEISDLIFKYKSELIILDSLSCLIRSGFENTAEGWQLILEWLLFHRSRGRSFLLIHHAGKDGSQRGTSSREDQLDISLELKHPNDYSPESGAEFVLSYVKSRIIWGIHARPQKISMIEVDGAIYWSGNDLEEATYRQVIDLSREGHKQVEIANILGIHESNVSRHLKKARSCGDVPPKK